MQKAAGYVGRQGGLGGSEGEREESGTVCGSGWYRRYEEGKRLPYLGIFIRGLLRTVVGVGLFEYLRGRMDGDGWRKRF